MQDEKTIACLISGQACMPETAYDEMLLTKNMYGKNNGRQYIHIVQSFSPDENLDHQTAHEIAQKLALKFDGFQALIATHQDRNHIHSHIVLNSVNYDTGLKFQQSRKELQEVKDYSDEICKSYGLSVIEEKDKTVNRYIPMEVYQSAMKGDSWKFKLINAIDDALSETSSKDDFIRKLESIDYKVLWEDSRKHIIFTTPDGKKCRSNKLYDEKYTKEGLLYEINKSKTKYCRITEERTTQIGQAKTGNSNPSSSEPTSNLTTSEYHSEQGLGERSRLLKPNFRNPEQSDNKDSNTNRRNLPKRTSKQKRNNEFER